jgi:hypothetical protein
VTPNELAAHVAEPVRIPIGPRPRHLRVVDAQARRRERRMRFAVWGFGVVTAVSVFIAVAFHVLLAQSEFQYSRLSTQTAEARRAYERARLAVAELGAPERIVARAEAIGMVPADDIRVVNAPPGLGSPSTDGDALGTAPAAPSIEWEKVKPHLAAQP